MRPSFVNPFGSNPKARASTMDFQTSSRDALQRIESMILSKKQDLCLDLISEFVFLEKHVSRVTSGQVGTLNLVQEFQLIIVLCGFFERSSGTEVTKNAVFLSLFGGSVCSFVSRLKVLVKLISTAVSGSMLPVLQAASVWMHQIGPNSSPCLAVAKRLIDDFVCFSYPCPEPFRLLPKLSPKFTIHFMTSATEMYLVGSNSPAPPTILVKMFTEWMLEYPTLCLKQHTPLALPVGAVPMPIVTPLAGLIRWSVLAPIYVQPQTDPDVFGELHLSVLQCLSQISSVSPKLSSINSLHLETIVSALQETYSHNHENLQISLERFAQCIQLALDARTISGNTNQLLCSLEELQKNPLLQIVIKTHKKHI